MASLICPAAGRCRIENPIPPVVRRAERLQAAGLCPGCGQQVVAP